MKKDKTLNAKIVDFVIIALLLLLLISALGCEEEIHYQEMHVLWAQTWECYQEKELHCGNRGFTTEQEWLEHYGGIWDVRVDYANRTVGKYHFKPVE
jgi:hypothetical protein